jgi:GntP family gluconate:H+ symporter
MALGSIAAILKWSGTWGDISIFLGKPIIALAGGVIFGIFLLAGTKRMSGFYEMTDDTLRVVGPILFVTAAGGVLGKVITEAGFVSYIKANAATLSSVGIFFPFVIAAILKIAQGSSTVAITTTSAIMGSFAASDSMMAALGLNTPLAAAFTVMAIGAGAMTVSHANDSYFWVVTNFGGMTPEKGYKTQTVMTMILGIATILEVFLLTLIF